MADSLLKRRGLGHRSKQFRGALIGMSVLLQAALFSVTAQGQTLSPFKDDLFRYGRVLESRDEGRVETIDYNERRDVNGRDAIPVKQAKPEYVALDAVRDQQRVGLKTRRGTIDTFRVGNPRDAKFAVIFIHGAGGDATLGANDWTFGGNFNRLKNLAVLNGGVYYSPSAPGFDSDFIGELVNHIAAQAPHAKIVISCGSAGSSVCWGLANNRDLAPKLSGIVIVGGFPYRSNLKKSPAIQARVPLYWLHGTRDPVVSAKTIVKQYEKIRELDPTYPVRLTFFNNGIHGTPIRMIDWRDTLTWLFAESN